MSSSPSENSASFGRLLVAALGFVFFIINLINFYQQSMLKHYGMATQGTVTRSKMVRRKGGVAYNIDYGFVVSGRSYQGSGQVGAKTFFGVQPGSTIDIRYVPSSPSISETTENSHNSASLFLTEFLGFPASLFMMITPFRTKRAATQSPTDELFHDEPPIDTPPMIKGIAFTMYPVLDMRRARQFYEGELGLRATKDLRGEWVEYHLWDSCFALTTLAKDIKPSADAGGSIALEVEKLDAFVDQLRKKGIRIKLEPFTTRLCRMSVVIDTEGNALTLHQKNS